MKYFYLFFFFIWDSAKAQFVNVCVDSMSTGETTICMNATNPNQIIASSNGFRIYQSNNGGLTWNSAISPVSTWINSPCCDPCLLSDTAGNFYYFYMGTVPYGFVSYKSKDGGITWLNETAIGVSNSKFEDKEWACVDLSNSAYRNNIYLVWTESDTSFLPIDSSIILFSKSINAGLSWSPPMRISHTAGNCTLNDLSIGAAPTTGPNGEIYVTWMRLGIRFNKSLDGGNTWLSNDVTVDSPIPSYSYFIPDTMLIRVFPTIASDRSGGIYNGNIYICWSDQRNGINNADVFLAKSSNGGVSWNTTKVNNDNTISHQFYPSMTVDQATGYIYTVFYDRRNYNNNDSTDVYLAYSTNGGNSFSNVKISATAFNPPISASISDYISIAAANNSIRPFWTRADSITTTNYSLWTALIDYDHLTSVNELSGQQQNTTPIYIYPNPSYTTLQVEVEVLDFKSGINKIEIFDELGSKHSTTIISNPTTTIDISSLSHGIYFLHFSSDKIFVMKKFIKQ